MCTLFLPDIEGLLELIVYVDTGAVVRGEKSIEEMGAEILEYVIQVAIGEIKVKAAALGQDDFIPWKCGISL